MRFMLDKDSCIALIKRRPAGMLRRMTSLAPGEVGLSAITVAELRYGVAKSAQKEQNSQALTGFLLPLEIADFDEAAANAYGEVLAALERSGKTISPLDALIGAHALSLGAVLVTHNTHEFRRIKALAVEDWLA
jgi:tRNA(fMet)-specific endonuclease VapC